MPECSYDMTINDLCEANKKLPDNNANYDVNNCPGGSDVFKYKGGEKAIVLFQQYIVIKFDIVIFYHLIYGFMLLICRELCMV